MTMSTKTGGAVLLATVLLAPSAFAQGVQPNECGPDETLLEKLAYTKALSLELRGRLPSLQEYASLEAEGDVPEALLDAWLASEAFADRMVRHHRDLLWNNIDGVSLFSYAVRLGGGPMWRRDASIHFRGGEIGCLDEPAQFSDDGRILFTESVRTRVENGQEIREALRREGYVEVEPYWAPGTTTRV